MFRYANAAEPSDRQAAELFRHQLGDATRPFIITEPIGPSIAELMSWSPMPNRRLPRQLAYQIGIGLCDALFQLHEMGFIHRFAIKCVNVRRYMIININVLNNSCVSPYDVFIRTRGNGKLPLAIEDNVVLANLGFARTYKHYTAHRGPVVPFVGATGYCSGNTNSHYKLTPEDDLISLLFIVAEWYVSNKSHC